MPLALALALACAKPAPPVAAVPPPSPVHTWQTSLGREHPWAGRIWSVADGDWIEESAMLAQLREADVVLLGEKHDNPDHHVLQARLIRALATPDTAVVFEHLDHADPVDATTPDALADAVGWSASGWPDFAIYRPVFEAVFATGAEVVPGHPTKAEVRSAYDGGIDDAERKYGNLRYRPLEAEARSELVSEIVASHCGMLDEDGAAGMVDAQVFKDAWMTGEVARAGAPAIVVAGTGHTRPDRGIPWHLDGDARTVAFVEVIGQSADPGAPEVAGLADYAWYTPRVDDADPCAAFRGQLEGLRPR